MGSKYSIVARISRSKLETSDTNEALEKFSRQCALGIDLRGTNKNTFPIVLNRIDTHHLRKPILQIHAQLINARRTKERITILKSESSHSNHEGNFAYVKEHIQQIFKKQKKKNRNGFVSDESNWGSEMILVGEGYMYKGGGGEGIEKTTLIID